MTDVAASKMKNKLIEWELTENPLAPLTVAQRDTVLEMSEEVSIWPVPIDLPIGDGCRAVSSTSAHLKDESKTDLESQDLFLGMACNEIQLDTTLQFLMWYSQMEGALEKTGDVLYLDKREILLEGRRRCLSLLTQIDSSLKSLHKLTEQYEVVSTKTNSLHQVSEQLLADQTKLNEMYESVGRRLEYFTTLDRLSSQISSSTLDVTSEAFVRILDRIDQCMEYMGTNGRWLEAGAYRIKYTHCLTRALAMVERSVVDALEHAAMQASASAPGDTGSALGYGRFQASAPKVRPLLAQIESRTTRSQEYEHLLVRCQQSYFAQRDLLMTPSVRTAMNELTHTAAHQRDHCSLVRSGCAFLVHICHDEHQLFYQFFQQPTPLLTGYLEGLCTTLYDMLRPLVIHMNHLETLAEVCSILRLEMLQEHVNNNPGPLEAFGRVAWQLLHDVQERLVYRAHCYLQTDVLQYQPSPGDLAYPEKLEMMESIAQSLHDQSLQSLRRSESRSSLASVGSATSQEVARINSDNPLDQPRSRTGNSPADLHGMWYPTVRRVLVCLSRLYRCVDRPIFQGLSQEALTMCIQSIAHASTRIAALKSPVDGELFQIKHLLILREQIAPFQVDFTVKEMSLDFSKVKTAAFGLLNKRKRLFSFSSNNAILEFLLEGTPQVREQLVDSRKEVDRQLKTSCETFIVHVTKSIAGSVLRLVEKCQEVSTNGECLSKQAFASPEVVANTIHETQRLIKTVFPAVQRSMQLYLANRETEFILLRPIKNNVVGCLGQLHGMLVGTHGYTADDLLMIGCPTQEQVSVLISSACLSLGSQPAVSPVEESQEHTDHADTRPVEEGQEHTDHADTRPVEEGQEHTDHVDTVQGHIVLTRKEPTNGTIVEAMFEGYVPLES